MNSCAFTGHRPEKLPFGLDENHPNTLKLKGLIAKHIDELYDLGINRFFVGCSRGVDLWAAEAVLNLKKHYPNIELICAVPFPEQPLSWTLDEKKYYYSILERSDHIDYIDYTYRKGVYFKRNRFLVDNCNILTAVCSFSDAEKGGSHYTIDYAIKKRRCIFCIDPIKLDISEILLNLDHLVMYTKNPL